jgi:hypothetical protein
LSISSFPEAKTPLSYGTNYYIILKSVSLRINKAVAGSSEYSPYFIKFKALILFSYILSLTFLGELSSSAKL